VPGVRINPLDLHPGDGTDALYRRTMFMQTFLAVLTATRNPGAGMNTATGLTDREAAALDHAVLTAYRANGITTDPRSWRRPAPLLADVAAVLAEGDEAGRNLALRLRPYVSGSFKTLFDGATSTPPIGHLVVYAIKDVPDELLPVVTLLVLDAIWRQVSNTPADHLQLVLVDEAWRLLSSGAGAEFLKQLAKGARKFGAGLTVVTQDAADVLATDIGRAVVSNAATQILLRQAPQAIDAVADAFALTGGERDFLLSAAPGDALLASGASRVAFHSLADQTEAELAHTGPAA
jgi:type IV secretory pathway VirB4 component